MDEHDRIAATVADIFVSTAYVHTVKTDREWAVETAMAEITPDSLKRAIALAIAAFAREYGLKPYGS